MFAGMDDVLSHAEEMQDKDARADYITSYCNDMQTKAFEDGKQILHEVISAQNGDNANPMELKLNASKYQEVPQAPDDGGFLNFHFPDLF